MIYQILVIVAFDHELKFTGHLDGQMDDRKSNKW